MWEYKAVKCYGVVDESIHQNVLNQYGAMGWELVSVVGSGQLYMFYFKRKKQ